MEYWDIYDQDRNKTGKQIKEGSALNKNGYRLVAHLCITLLSCARSYATSIKLEYFGQF